MHTGFLMTILVLATSAGVCIGYALACLMVTAAHADRKDDTP